MTNLESLVTGIFVSTIAHTIVRSEEYLYKLVKSENGRIIHAHVWGNHQPPYKECQEGACASPQTSAEPAGQPVAAQ